jgi:shikimate kinase
MITSEILTKEITAETKDEEIMIKVETTTSTTISLEEVKRRLQNADDRLTAYQKSLTRVLRELTEERDKWQAEVEKHNKVKNDLILNK